MQQNRLKQYQALACLLLVTLTINCVAGKYAHNVDVTDWSSKNIGRIKDAIIDRSKIYFLGNNGLFGYMNKENGVIQVSHGIDSSRNISWKSQDEEYNEKIIIQDAQGLFSYNVVKSKFDEINTSNIIGKMIDYSILNNESQFVLTESELRLVSKTSSESVITAIENQNFKKILKIQQNGYALLSVFENNQLCVHIVSKDKLINKKVSNLSIETGKCWSKSAEEYTSENLKTLLVSSQYIVFDKKAFVLSTEVFVDLPEAKENDTVHLDMKTGVYVIVRGYIATFYVLDQNQFYQAYQFNKDGIYQYSFDHQVSNKKLYSFLGCSKGECELYQIPLENPQQPKQAILLAFFKPKYDEVPPIKFWLKSKDTQEILIQDSDLRTYFLNPEKIVPGVKGSGEKWSREDGLSELDGIILVDYAQAQDKKINPYYESLDKNGVNNPLYLLPNLQRRITQEVKNVINYFQQNYSSVIQFFQELVKVRTYQQFTNLNKLMTSDAEYDITYGLKKVIVGVNKQRTIYSIDSKSGEILWKTSFIARYVTPDYDFHGFYQIENRQGDTVTEQTLLIYHSPVTTKMFVFTVQPLTGELGYVSKFLMQKVRKVFKIHLQTDSVQQAIAVIDQDYNVYGYPNSVQNPLAEDKHDNIFYMYDQETRTLNGYRYVNGKFNKIWNYLISSNEEIVDIQSADKEQNHPKIALFDDTKVILKHIDYSNIAILTKKATKETLNGNGILSLTIFNCKSGRQIYSAYEQNVNLNYPISLVYDENGVFVSYYNPVYSIYQIWTVELFSNKMENDFVSMLQNYYFSSTGGKYEDFNYINENLDIIALEQKYGYSLGIKKMRVVTTKLSLTKRNLMIITPNNQIHSLDRDILSTRRAVKTNLNSQQIGNSFTFESTTLPPYSYMIPIDKLSVISYHSNLNDIKEIKFSGSNLESTIIFVAYGNDVFASSIAPDRTYDMINEDFNYVIVTLSIIVAFVGVFLARKYAAQSTLNKLFENKEIVTAM